MPNPQIDAPLLMPRAFEPNGRPRVAATRLDYRRPPDATFINLNLMLVNADGTFDQQHYLPLGLLYMAGVAERAGYNIEHVDYQLFNYARHFDAKLFVDAVECLAPVVCISCMSNLLPFALVVAEAVKQREPEAVVVLGGVGPSPVARGIVEAFPMVDIVVEGEGEANILGILAGDREPLPPVRIVNDLDSLPLPAYGLIDFENYDAMPSVITSRGCPYKCTFCTEPYNFSGSVRFRNVDSILEEIELVHMLSGRNTFLFQDDILPLKPSRFRRLLAGMRALPFPIEWKCFSRVDLMNDALMQEMAESGCVQIRYGIEAGSDKTLERIRKGFTIETAYDVAARSVNTFPSVHCSFIWGYPFETAEDFEETLRWVERFEASGCTVLLFEYAPLPGSPLYRMTNAPLTFSRDRYSIYVITGHEVVDGLAHRIEPMHRPIFDLIQKHPTIFSGFYEYQNRELLEMKRRLGYFNANRKSELRNEYDL